MTANCKLPCVVVAAAQLSVTAQFVECQGCHFLSAAEVAAESAAEFVVPAASVVQVALGVAVFAADIAGLAVAERKQSQMYPKRQMSQVTGFATK